MFRSMPRAIAVLLAAVSTAPGFSHPAAAANPASNLLTFYSFGSPGQINWTTCGSTAETSGCYDSGNLGNLTNACAIMEGLPHVTNKSPTNFVVIMYVMDAAAKAAGGTKLNVYKKTDTITPTFDTTTITLSARIALSLTGGAVKCFMAGNETALFLGTNKSTNAAEVTIAGLQVSPVGGFTPPITVSQITASDNGSVAVSFGTGNDTGFIIFGPGGVEGGGSAFVINNIQGIQLP